MMLRLLCLLTTLPLLATAQDMPGDSILAHERSIDRPITLHARQLRITASYDVSLLSRRFDATGRNISLRDMGASSVRHRYALDLKYGITQFVQFTAAISARGHVIRQRDENIPASDEDPAVSYRLERKYSGIEDVFVGIDLRAPLKTRKLDLAVALGVFLPTASSLSSVPEHSFESAQQDGGALHRYVYRYEYPPGHGVAVVRVGARGKYRTARWAFSSGVDYQHGLKDGAGLEWKHQLNSDGAFQYRKVALTYRLPDSFDYFVEVEYQPSPSVDLILHASGYTAYEGWTSRLDDLKVAVPYQTVVICSPGVEILVTPRLWLRERVNFALAGKNHDAILGAETTVMYNLFP